MTNPKLVLTHLMTAYPTWYPESMSQQKAEHLVREFGIDYKDFSDVEVLEAYKRIQRTAKRPPFLADVLSTINEIKIKNDSRMLRQKPQDFDPPIYVDENGHEWVYYKDLGPAGAEFMEKFWGMR